MRRAGIGAGVAALVLAASASPAEQGTYRVASVTDGDTIVRGNGQRVRLVQIDTPEVFFGTECYGSQASATMKRLLPVGARVRLSAEPTTDSVDDYGRLLRYVVRASDGVNVNLRLVAVGAAAPYFYSGRRGKYANQLERLAKRARAKGLGLWGACPRTPYDPYRGSRRIGDDRKREGRVRTGRENIPDVARGGARLAGRSATARNVVRGETVDRGTLSRPPVRWGRARARPRLVSSNAARSPSPATQRGRDEGG